jgi:hypothetical protein
VAELASAGLVLGLADVVVLNDPITGQGSNNASKCAMVYLERTLERGDAPFDPEWMQERFERYWDYAQSVSGWTNALLAPPPEHVLNLLGAAGQNQRIAKRFVDGFDDPRDFFEWFMTPRQRPRRILRRWPRKLGVRRTAREALRSQRAADAGARAAGTSSTRRAASWRLVGARRG